MEAKDLRIGNYVCQRHNHLVNAPGYATDISKPMIIHTIKPVRGRRYFVRFNGAGYDTDVEKSLVPIPLTDEWLERLGFRLVCGYGWEISTDEGSFLWIDPDDDFTFSFGVPYEASGNRRQIKYVHELQNLYYALVGRDLAVRAVAPTCQ